MLELAETALSNHPEADGLIFVGLFLLAGFLAHVLGERVHVPRITVVLLMGFIAGPSALNLIPAEATDWFPLATELALSMIGFQLGERFLGKTLKETGVLVLCVAILPFLGVGGMQIYRAEMPGPSKDRLTPRIATTAKLLWGVYLLLCLLEAGLLRIGGMDWFDSFRHAFATMATGGFSTRTASVAAYNSVYIEIVIIVFMFLAGANFALTYRALRGHPLCYFKDPEFRFYLGAWLTATLLIVLNIYNRVNPSFWSSVRMAFFQSTSIMTTTGFCTEDFDRWPGASKVLLILLMFIGGCAGSTGGGMKNIRVFVVVKKALRELRLFMQPQAVLKVKIGGNPVGADVVSHITAFFVLFVLVFALGTLSMTWFTPDIQTALSSVIATLGNIGPGLNAVGATQNYAAISPLGQGILTVFMLLGRLELYTVLILFLPSFWKK